MSSIDILRTAGSHRSPIIWPYVWKLLRLRLLLAASSFRRSSRKSKIFLTFLSLLAVGIVILIFMGSRWVLNFLSSPELVELVPDSAAILGSVPTLILFAVFGVVLISSFGILLQALYLAGDMEFLLSTPVPSQAIFTAKLLQAVIPNFTLFALFAVPILFGLGAASGHSGLYYPLSLVMMAAFAMAAAGIASLLVMAIVRIFPARRIAEVLAFFGAVISMLCSQAGYLAQSINFEAYTQDEGQVFFRLLTVLNNPWFPLAWPGQALTMVGESRWTVGIGLTFLSLLVAGSVFLLALVVSERLYMSGWAGMQSIQRKKKKPVTNGKVEEFFTKIIQPFSGFISKPVQSLVIKDFLVIRRDLRNLSQVITPLIFGIIYGFVLIRSGGEPPMGRGEAPDWFEQILRNAYFYASTGISLFVSWTLLSRLAMMGFSQEGRSYWILKSAPIHPKQLIRAKFLVAFLPALALGWIFLVILSITQGTPLSVIIYGLAVTGLCTGAIAGINLAFGAASANLEWEDPRQMVKGKVGCVGGLVSLITLPITLILFVGPPILFPLLQLPAILGQLSGLLVGGALCLLCAFLPLRLIEKKVTLLGEK